MISAFGSGGQPLWEAIWGATIDQLLAWHDHTTGAAHIPIVDHRNSIVTTWNMAQAAVGERAEYNPHGRLTLQSATGPPCTEEGSAGKVCPNPAAMPFGFVSAYRSPATRPRLHAKPLVVRPIPRKITGRAHLSGGLSCPRR
ncbi:MAG: hypothetical protein H0U74_13835 [Bradymonadaceae bacterium]|nr:hypothetical protein [Lujinxingiaceae bacterium]